MTSKIPNNAEKNWTLPALKNKAFNLRINRNILVTLILSLLLHLSLLWIFAPKLFSIGAPQKDAPPLEITLGPPQKKEVAPSELVLPDLRPLPQPPIKTKPAKQAKPKKPPVAVVKDAETKVVKKEKVNKERPKLVPKETSLDPLPGEDMQAYIKRQKEAKLAKKGFSERDIEQVLASNNPQSAGDKRDAKIKENLNIDGTNGIFEIKALNQNAAQFSFKGWKNNVNTARLEIFDVTVSDAGSIKHAVIKRMIAIIRRDYEGDFNWDSRRLRRVLLLSARPEDNEALEAFMMLEFFGPGSPVR